MLNWTLRELLLAPQQLVASVAAVAGAFLLVLFFEGVFAGESVQIVALIDKTDADVWVMQKGVGNMHMTTSFVSDWKVDAVAEVEGVAKATPILYMNTTIEAGGRNWFSYVVGVEANDPRVGPWQMAAGAAHPSPGGAVVPEIFASDAGLKLGDTVRIGGRDFRVDGFSRDTFSMANSISFVSFGDLADLMNSLGAVSYILVDAKPGVDPQALADRIKAQVENVNALPRAVFVAHDYSIAVQMGLNIIWIMTLIGGALAVLLTGFVVYSHVTERERELAVMKALGVHNRSIYAAMCAQALIIGGLAFILSLALMAAAMPLTAVLAPKISLAITADAVMRVGATALAVSLVAAVIPVRRIVSVDPVTAFQQ